MAARPLLLGLASAARSGSLGAAFRSVPRRSFQVSAAKLSPSVATSTPSSGGGIPGQAPPTAAAPGQIEDSDDSKHAAFLGEADSNDGHDAVRDAFGNPIPALDANNAAFLGEADSDDGFEALRAAEGDKHEPMDGTNAAFLGEADSDDGFEAHRAAEGDKHEPMDGTNAAFLGEADSDDGFEMDKDIHPEKHDHRIQDTSSSGFHGERGEHDQ